jgi:hypothetical protein
MVWFRPITILQFLSFSHVLDPQQNDAVIGGLIPSHQYLVLIAQISFQAGVHAHKTSLFRNYLGRNTDL